MAEDAALTDLEPTPARRVPVGSYLPLIRVCRGRLVCMFLKTDPAVGLGLTQSRLRQLPGSLIRMQNSIVSENGGERS